jgi:hypothetical protein
MDANQPAQSLYETVNSITSAHINLSRQYGCRAYMTVVTFLFAGVVHRARRFFREDMPTTGRIELYTLEPHAGQWTTWTTCTPLGWYESAHCEDDMGYVAAVPTSRRDRIATVLVEAAVTGNELGLASSERFAQMEMV